MPEIEVYQWSCDKCGQTRTVDARAVVKKNCDNCLVGNVHRLLSRTEHGDEIRVFRVEGE